jgi:hypothetical protein
MNPRVTSVTYKSRYKLLITFENNELKEFNLSPYLHYPVFESLKDESFCSNVKVFNGTVIWDDVTDFDPDTLYLESKILASA